MTPETKIRRRRSASRHGHGGSRRHQHFGGWGGLITTLLFLVILMVGPACLGAARLWIELPLLGMVALLVVVQGLRLTARPRAEEQRRVDFIDLSVALFVLYAVARWLTSPVEYFSRIEAMAVVAYAGVFLTCRYGMANRRYCMILLYLLVMVGVGETAFGYYLSNHLDWFPFGPAEQTQLHYAPRWVGTYDSANFYACFLVMAIGAALALGSLSKLAWPVRIVMFYLSIMMMVGVIYSGSRGSWIALLGAICALLFLGIRHGTTRWWVPVAGVLVLVVVSGFLFSLSPLVRERLDSTQVLLSGGNLAADDRVRLAEESLQIARHHAIFGTGPGTFAFVQPQYQSNALKMTTDVAHDDYLNCLDDYGTVGLGLAMLFIAAVSLKFLGPLIVDNRWQDRVLVATGFAAWVALLLHSLLDSNLHVPANALLLFSLTGLAMGRMKEDKQPHWISIALAPLGRWLGVAVVLLGLAYGARVTQTALGDRAYEKVSARWGEIPLTDEIAAAEEALRYDPGNAQALVLLGDSHQALAALQKDSAAQQAETGKALEAYLKARKANPLDLSIKAKIDGIAKQ